MLVASRTVATQRRSIVSESVVNFSNRPEERGWSTIAQGNTLGRELPEALHDRQLEISFKAYRANPFAHRLIEMQTNFVLGNGLTLTSTDAEILLAVAQFWKDEYNDWEGRIQQRLRDLWIYGEWVNFPMIGGSNADTMVWIGDIQPDKLARLHPDQYDHGVVDKAVFKVMIDPKTGKLVKEHPVDVIRKRLDFARGRLDKDFTGECFYAGINRSTDSLRGVGELFPILDLLDLHDQLLFSRANRVKLQNSVYFDLKIDGMTEDQMYNYLQANKNLPPGDGGVYAHNPNMELTPKTVDMKADDFAKDAAVVKSYIVASAGWPGTWFDDPGTAGRAVGAEMAEPALRNIVNLQLTVNRFLRRFIDFYLDTLVSRGAMRADWRKAGYTLSFNKPSSRDISRIAPAMLKIGQLLKAVGEDMPVLNRAELRQLFVSQINQLGLSDAPLSMELPTEVAETPTAQQAANQAQADAMEQAQQIAKQGVASDRKAADAKRSADAKVQAEQIGLSQPSPAAAAIILLDTQI